MTHGQTNFEAYKECVEGVTHDGRIIPDWVNLTDEVRTGWEAGAQAVLENDDTRVSLVH